MFEKLLEVNFNDNLNVQKSDNSDSLDIKNILETFNYRMVQQARAEKFRAYQEFMSTKPINNASSISYWQEEFKKTYPLY
jgi:hypothetical protein